MDPATAAQTASSLPLVINGGAVGIAAAALAIIYKMVTNHNAHTNQIIEQTNQVINRNTEAMLKSAESSEKHTGVLNRLIDRL